MLGSQPRSESTGTLSDGWVELGRPGDEAHFLAAAETHNSLAGPYAKRVVADGGSDFDADAPALSGDDTDDGDGCQLMPPVELLQPRSSVTSPPTPPRAEQRDAAVATDPVPAQLPARPTSDAQSQTPRREGAAQHIACQGRQRAAGLTAGLAQALFGTSTGRQGLGCTWLSRHMRPYTVVAMLVVFALGAVLVNQSQGLGMQGHRCGGVIDLIIDLGDERAVLAEGRGREDSPAGSSNGTVPQLDALRRQVENLKAMLGRQRTLAHHPHSKHTALGDRGGAPVEATTASPCGSCASSGGACRAGPQDASNAAVCLTAAGTESSNWLPGLMASKGPSHNKSLGALGTCTTHSTCTCCSSGTTCTTRSTCNSSDRSNAASSGTGQQRGSGRASSTARSSAVLAWQLHRAQQRVQDLLDVQSELYAARAQLEAADAELATVSAQREVALQQRDAARAERDAALGMGTGMGSAQVTRAARAAESSGQHAPVDWQEQLAAARAERDGAEAEAQAARAERDSAKAERDAAKAEAEAARAASDAAMAERDAAMAERDAAMALWDTARAEAAAVKGAAETTRVEAAAAVFEVVTLTAQLAAVLEQRDNALLELGFALASREATEAKLSDAQQQLQDAHERIEIDGELFESASNERKTAWAHYTELLGEHDVALGQRDAAVAAHHEATSQRDAAVAAQHEATRQRDRAQRGRAKALDQRNSCYAQLEAQAKQCQQPNNSTRAADDKRRAAHAEQQLGHVRSKLDKTLQKQEALRKQVSAFRKERDAAVGELIMVISERDVARQELNRCNTQHREAVSKYNAAEKAYNALATEAREGADKRFQCQVDLDKANAKRDAAVHERDVAVEQRDEAVSELERALQAIDRLIGERDAAVGEHDSAVSKLGLCRSQHEHAERERDVARRQRDDAEAERDAAVAERNDRHSAWLEAQADLDETVVKLVEAEAAQEVLVGGLLGGDRRQHGAPAA